MLRNLLFLCFSAWATGLFAQVRDFPFEGQIQAFLNGQAPALGLEPEDLTWRISDAYPSPEGKVWYVYLQQTYGGLGIHQATASLSLDAQGLVLHFGHRFLNQIAKRVQGNGSKLPPEQALNLALQALQTKPSSPIEILKIEGDAWVLTGGGATLSEVPAQLCYAQGEDETLYLAYDFSLEMRQSSDWWSLQVRASDGTILSRNNWNQSCQFEHSPFENCSRFHRKTKGQDYPNLAQNAPLNSPVPSGYRVFPFPIESPAHGPRSFLSNPEDVLASPYGWHDTNGATGAEFTITRGNNVHAYEDTLDQNLPGYSPDGGPNLIFDFPLNLGLRPAASLDAAITNLFYANNYLHDVWYRYGFNELSGNFQQNNYGRGGLGNDPVRAEAQDGGGTNNANFATPPDGQRPRMQMYLWTGQGAGRMEVASPSTIQGNYGMVEAGFGPRLGTTPLNGEVILAIDNIAPSDDGCSALSNAAAVQGKIVLIDRGTCNFIIKAQNAQNAGAIAMIVSDNTTGSPFAMGGTGTINIPCVMISQADGQRLRNALSAGNPPQVSLVGANNVARDGDYDNGVIAHEYGHGISNRLTGGPSNANCLGNDEQMGEGWSDWIGLMLTMKAGDQRGDVRGYGTFASGQPINGTGIRPAPYSTDRSINNFTYASTNNANISRPHGIGFVWATMLWDLTWDLIDLHGFDSDFNTGTGGNNIAMRLVTEGMKLQPCSPGFVDGRDAILLADRQLYNGAHQCLIWQAFAGRGLGFSASQGSPASRSDQVQAFDLPPLCQTPTAPPRADFRLAANQTCTGFIAISDSSNNTPQQWFWDFGDGNQDTTPRLTGYQYQNTGNYTLRLIVSNSLGSDTLSRQISYQALSPANISPNTAQICPNQSLSLQANLSSSGNLAQFQWRNSTDSVLATGLQFNTGPLSNSTSIILEHLQREASSFVGPANENIGAGGMHTAAFRGTVNFTAFQPLEIRSVLVNAGGPGLRTLSLWAGDNGSGSLIWRRDIFIPQAGPLRLNLNIVVPAAGNYSLGADGPNLYRNSEGATYPYTQSGLISLTGSSAGSDFYYYFYNWEVAPLSCRSQPDTLAIAVRDLDFSFQASGNVLLFQASGSSSNLTWDFGDGNTATGSNPQHTYAQSGTYQVVLSDGNCTRTRSVEVLATSIQTMQAQDQPRIWPQPTVRGRQTAVLSFPQAFEQRNPIQIVASDGRLVQVLYLEQGQTQINLPQSGLAAGVYFLTWKDALGLAQQLPYVIVD